MYITEMEWIYYAQYVANNGRPEWDRDGNLTFKLPCLTKKLNYIRKGWRLGLWRSTGTSVLVNEFRAHVVNESRQKDQGRLFRLEISYQRKKQ